MNSGTIYKIYTIDIEATASLTPTAVGVTYCNSFIFFFGTSCIEQFLDWLHLKRVRGVFFTHRLTLCGLLLLNFQNTQASITGIYSRGEILQLCINTSSSSISIRCSFKLFPLPLYQIAGLLYPAVGQLYVVNGIDILKHIELLKDDQELTDKKAIFKRSKLKTTVVQSLITKLSLQFQNWKNLHALSISGLAIEIFKKWHNPHAVNLTLNSKHDALIRRSFWGGRCEVFGNLEQAEFLHYFDFKGMYASVMQQKFCFGDVYVTNSYTQTINTAGYYHVTVYSNNMRIPLLPMRNSAGQVYFPNGCWSGTYWWEELLFFLKNGGVIKKVHFQITFAKSEHALLSFSEHFTKLRERDAFSNSFYKLFVNSLYGRLGMHTGIEKTEVLPSNNSPSTATTETFAGKKIFLASVESTQDADAQINSNVALAAAIAAKARIKLNQALLDVERAGGRILYVDTDSIYAAFKEKMVNVAHGDVFWDARTAFTFDRAIFATQKGYALKNDTTEIVRLRGFKTNSFTFAEFKEHFEKKLYLKKTQNVLFKKQHKLQYLAVEKSILLNSYNKRIFNESKTQTQAAYFVKNTYPADDEHA